MAWIEPAIPSGEAKIAFPATSTLAPAATTRGVVVGSIPPSTCTSTPASAVLPSRTAVILQPLRQEALAKPIDGHHEHWSSRSQ
jgi:hypothetical protein